MPRIFSGSSHMSNKDILQEILGSVTAIQNILTDPKKQSSSASTTGDNVSKLSSSASLLKIANLQQVGNEIKSLAAGVVEYYKNRKKIAYVSEDLPKFLKGISDSLNTLDAKNLKKFKELAFALAQLNSFSFKTVAKIAFAAPFFSMIGEGVTNFVKSINGLSKSDYDKCLKAFVLIKLFSSLKPISPLLGLSYSIGTKGLLHAAVHIKKFFTELGSIKQKGVSKSIENLKTLNESLFNTEAVDNFKYASKNLKEEYADVLVGFYSTLISGIQDIEIDNKKLKALTKNLNTLSDSLKKIRSVIILLATTVAIIVGLTLVVGLLLKNQAGTMLMGLVAVFAILAGLVIALNKIKIKKVKQAENTVKILNVFVLTVAALALTVAAVALVTKIVSATDMLAAFIIVGVSIGAIVGIIWILNKIQHQLKVKQAQNAIKNVMFFLTTVGIFALELVTISLLSKLLKWKDIIKSFVILAASLAATWVLVKIIKVMPKKDLIKSSTSLLLLVGVVGALSLVGFVIAKLGTMKTSDLTKGGAVLTDLSKVVFKIAALLVILGVVTGGAGTGYLLAGAAALGIISVSLAILVGTAMMTVKLVKMMSTLDKEQVNGAMKSFSLVIVGIGTTMANLLDVKILAGVLAGVVVIPLITLELALMCIAVLAVKGLFALVKGIGDIKTSTKEVVDVFSSIRNMIAEITNTNVADTSNNKNKNNGFLGVIGKLVGTVFRSAANFISGVFNVLQQVPQLISIFLLVFETGFLLFAITIIRGIVHQVKKITESMDLKQFKNSLIGEDGIFSTITSLIDSVPSIGIFTMLKIQRFNDTFRPLVKSISKWMDVVAKLATMKIATKWDKNGNPIEWQQLDKNIFTNAATTIADNFAYFVQKLNDSFGSLSDDAVDAMKSLKKTMGPLMQSVGTWVDVVLRLATMQIADKWDTNGNPIHYRKLFYREIGSAATVVKSTFSSFITALGNAFSSLKEETIDAMDSLKDSMTPIMDSVSSFVNAILAYSGGKVLDHFDKDKNGNQVPIYKVVTAEDIKNSAKSVAETFTSFISNLLNSFQTNNIKEKAEEFNDDIKDFLNNIMDPISKYLNLMSAYNGQNAYRITGYDNNGNPIFDMSKPISFKTQSNNLFSYFATFVNNLTKWINSHSAAISKANEQVPTLNDFVSNISSSMSTYFDTLSKVAKNMNLAVDSAELNKVAKNTSEALTNALLAPVSAINKFLQAKVNFSAINSSANYLKSIFEKFASISSSMKSIAKNFGAKERNGIFTLFDAIKHSLRTLTSKRLAATTKSMNSFMWSFQVNAMRFMKSVNSIAIQSNRLVAHNDKIRGSIQQLDVELVENQRKRKRALDELRDGLKEVADQLQNIASIDLGGQISNITGIMQNMNNNQTAFLDTASKNNQAAAPAKRNQESTSTIIGDVNQNRNQQQGEAYYVPNPNAERPVIFRIQMMNKKETFLRGSASGL